MNDNEWAWQKKHGRGSIKGLGCRAAFSALSSLLWFTILVTYLFFVADDYGIIQNIGMLIESIVVRGVVNVLI